MKASEVIQILARYIHQHGDLQVTVENQEFFTHSAELNFEIAQRTKEDVSPYAIDEKLDKRFITIRA